MRKTAFIRKAEREIVVQGRERERERERKREREKEIATFEILPQ